MLVGYARTSTADQKAGLATQERDLWAAGAEKVFAEQVSSVAQRGGLKACTGMTRRRAAAPQRDRYTSRWSASTRCSASSDSLLPCCASSTAWIARRVAPSARSA
jgi:hypothetical protein